MEDFQNHEIGILNGWKRNKASIIFKVEKTAKIALKVVPHNKKFKKTKKKPESKTNISVPKNSNVRDLFRSRN